VARPSYWSTGMSARDSRRRDRSSTRPIGDWLDLARSRRNDKHMEVVSWLKSTHGLGHGHANAIVAYVRAKSR
jgi:monomeric isocitrate dehydrogenase